jgi:protein arginine kinase activator
MCQDCPELQKRLHGIPQTSLEGSQNTGLCCGNCGTTLDSIKQGSPLGCSECYEIFKEILTQEIFSYLKPLNRFTKKEKIIHKGRSPGQSAKMGPAFKLLALNEALKETLQKEDYEQAALLRDQIKELTENTPDDRTK